MINNFFETNSYFIEEHIKLFKADNYYEVSNDKDESIGTIKSKLPVRQKMLWKNPIIDKNKLPFNLEVRDSNDVLLASISRGWTLSLSKITIKDANDNTIGFVKQKFSVTPSFKIYDSNKQLFAVIAGDLKAGYFTIKGPTDLHIGTISKKWAGFKKKIFTDGDKSNISNININPKFSSNVIKILMISLATTIDMLYKDVR